MPSFSVNLQVPVKMDARVMQISGIFDVPPSEQSITQFQVDMPFEEKEYSVGLIVGPSGSGKTTLARQAWPDKIISGYEWSQDKAVVSEFPKGVGIHEITGFLSSVGFSSPPSWLRPFHALCVDAETQILTKNGWRNYDQVKAGDEVLTLNHSSGMSEWQVISALNIYDVKHEPMLRVSGKAHSSLTTTEHRWPVIIANTKKREWRMSGGKSHQRLNTNHQLVTAALCSNIPEHPTYADEFVELVAWFYTEGNLAEYKLMVDPHINRAKSKTSQSRGVHWDSSRKKWFASISINGQNKFLGRYVTEHEANIAFTQADQIRQETLSRTSTSVFSIRIYQSHRINPKNVARIRLALHNLVGPPCQKLNRGNKEPHWREDKRKTSNTGMTCFSLSCVLSSQLEAAAPDKIPSSDFIRSLTKSQLDLFLLISKLGDGWSCSNGTVMFSQADSRRTDAYELAVILSGRTPSRWTYARTANDKYKGYLMYHCSISERTTVKPIHSYARQPGGRLSRTQPGKVIHVSEWINYDGIVWCPTTANSTWMARRDGKVFFTGNSNGEQFRVTLARALAEDRDLFVIDEFTSVVDRTVAQIGSYAVAKAVRRSGKKMVALSCHYDVIDWLQPDWIYEPAGNLFTWRSLHRRPAIPITIQRVDRSAWDIFKKHHYLSTNIHPGTHCYIAFWNGNPVAFLGMVHFPHPIRCAWRGSRMIVLPDYQGAGFGGFLFDYIAGVYKATGKAVTGLSSSPQMIHYVERSKLWKVTRKASIMAENVKRPRSIPVGKFGDNRNRRKTVSYEYIGPQNYHDAVSFGVVGK
jgi:GNAT superfamily N-acetyltransferase